MSDVVTPADDQTPSDQTPDDQARQRAKHPRRIEEVGLVDLDDDLVIYNGRTHEVHILDPVSAFVWENCDGERSIDDLAQLLIEASEDTDLETAAKAVRRVVARLDLLRLVSGHG